MDLGKYEFIKKYKKNNFILAGAAALGVIAVGVGTYLAVKSKLSQDKEEEILKLTYTPHDTEAMLSFEQAYNIALGAARKQFGENAFVIPVSEKKATEVAIDGEKRACYMFGADKADLNDGSMRGLYHVDALTGDIYDNGEGKMTKIN